MGNSMGQTRTLWTETLGRSIQLSADGAPKYKAGGVTFDWSSVPALANGDTSYMGVPAVLVGGKRQATFEDGVIIKEGEKALRYGAPVVRRASDGYYILGTATNVTAQAPVRSQLYLVNETWLEEDTYSNHPGVIEAGRVFLARVMASDVANADASATNATGYPTLAALLALLPGIVFAQD